MLNLTLAAYLLFAACFRLLSYWQFEARKLEPWHCSALEWRVWHENNWLAVAVNASFVASSLSGLGFLIAYGIVTNWWSAASLWVVGTAIGFLSLRFARAICELGQAAMVTLPVLILAAIGKWVAFALTDWN